MNKPYFLSLMSVLLVGSCSASSSPQRPRSTDLTNVYASRDEEYLHKHLPTWNRSECESALRGVNSEIAYFDQYEADCERYLIKNAYKSERSCNYAVVLDSLETTRILRDVALKRQLLITQRLAEYDGTDNDSSSDSEVGGSLYARYGII